jgi:chromosome segregation ATPase
MTMSSAQVQELSELRSRVEWLDEERRKWLRKMAEMDQRLALQERELEGRNQRIQSLEEQLAKAVAQIARLPQVDAILAQFKDEMVQMIEGYDQRRIQSEKELDRIRRVEHEVQAREIAELRKEMPAIGRLQNDMQLRQAEEARLANLIGVLQGRVGIVENRSESWSTDFTYLEEAGKQNSRQIGEIQTALLEISKRWEPIHNRLDILAHSVSRAEANIQDLTTIEAELKQSMKGWTEQIQLGEYGRNQRLEKWQRLLDEQGGERERFAREWVAFSDQYKEAKMAVQTLAEWQKQIEQQQREVAELARVEAGRMRTLWDNFLLDNEKRWKSTNVDEEQRWLSAQRREKQVLTQIQELSEELEKLEQEKELIWRVQSAQADAIRKIPRVWLEEVEKAMAQNPNSRRQPALVPVREE